MTETTTTHGSPVGMAFSPDDARRAVRGASGNLWLAAWSQGQVRCYSPAGVLAPHEHREHPLSGSLFLARPGCTGLPTHAWSGQLDTQETP